MSQFFTVNQVKVVQRKCLFVTLHLTSTFPEGNVIEKGSHFCEWCHENQENFKNSKPLEASVQKTISFFSNGYYIFIEVIK